MNYLKGKVSYLIGLAEGLEIDNTSKEGKLLNAIINTLDDIAVAVDDIIDVQEELSDQLEYLDEDLSEIESIIYEDEDDDDEDDTFLRCPYCDEKVYLGDAIIEGDIINCPKCHKKIEIVWDCDCGHHDIDDSDDNSE